MRVLFVDPDTGCSRVAMAPNFIRATCYRPPESPASARLASRSLC